MITYEVTRRGEPVPYRELAMSVDDIEKLITFNVAKAFEVPGQPARVLVGVPMFRALAAKHGAKGRDSAVLLTLHVFGGDVEVRVDCDRRVPNDEAWVYFLRMQTGAA